MDRLFKGPFGVSTREFFEALPPDLTIRELTADIYETRNFDQDYINHKTPFLEVDKVPYSHSPESLEILQEIETSPRIRGNWIQDLFKEVVRSIEDFWDPRKFHLIGSSSGVDSRIISRAIQELYIKHGKNWLGDYLFVEAGGEGDYFAEIMRSHKWRNYYIFGNLDSPGFFYEDFFDLEDYYKKFNGFVSYPVNPWRDAFKRLQSWGVIPKNNIQYITGYGSNELTEYGRKIIGLGNYFKWIYYLHVPGFRTISNDTLYPFYSHDFIKKLFTYKEPGEISTRISTIISYVISPETANIPNMETRHVRERGFRTVAPELLEDLQRQYISSWYGKQVGGSLKPEIDYKKSWGSYYMASLCEYLIDQGYNIKHETTKQIKR